MSLDADHGAGADPARARSWLDHLREGGTTAWSAWWPPRPAEPLDPPSPGGRVVVPGAQQLELLRRLNEQGRPSAVLRERVLTTSPVGRGQPDLELVGAVPPSAFGAPPVDPADLPEAELLRVAASLLAEDVVALGDRTPPRPPLPRPRFLRGGPAYHLVGDPLVADQVRRALVAHGAPPGGRRPLVVVAAGPLDRMLADTWSRRCLEQGIVPWTEWVNGLRQRRRLPPRIDLVAVAEAWAARVGRDQVRVVLDESALPGVLGGRAARRLGSVVRPGADAVELARRLASVLGVLVTARRREELLSQVVWPRLPRTTTPPPGVAEEHRDWLEARAATMARRLQRDGYPVVGDPAVLSRRSDGVPEPAATPVLGLALRVLLDGLGEEEGRRA